MPDYDGALRVDAARDTTQDGDDAGGEGEGWGPGDDGDGGKLMRCCDEALPHQPPPLVVEACTKPFVTIHDCVKAVHEWLQTVRDAILSARGVHEGVLQFSDTLLDVSFLRPHEVSVREAGNGRSFKDIVRESMTQLPPTTTFQKRARQQNEWMTKGGGHCDASRIWRGSTQDSNQEGFTVPVGGVFLTQT